MPQDAASALSYRDALDRAERLESPNEAMALLNRAELRGDSLLAKAIAATAFESGWGDVVSTYAQTRPDIAPAVNEIQEQAATKLTAANLFAFVPVPRPAEFAGMRDDQINQIADAT